MLHTMMPKAQAAGARPELVGLERQLAVLVRHLDGFGRRSDVYRGIEIGRAGYLLLMTLEESGPATIGRLASALGLDASTVTRQIATMEADGLVERTRDDRDRRRSVIGPSRRGAALLREVRDRRTRTVERMLEDWPCEDLEDLERLLGRLNEAITARVGSRPDETARR